METTISKDIKKIEEQEVSDKELLLWILKGILNLLRFNLYLVVWLIKSMTNLIEVVFLNDYKPLNPITNFKDGILSKKAAENVNQERMRFAVNQMTQHRFEFNRSIEFSSNYKVLQKILKDCTVPGYRLKDEVYRDALQRIDIIVVEAERESLKRGYEYAKETKYRFESEEAYYEFLRNRILKGEGISIHDVVKEEELKC